MDVAHLDLAGITSKIIPYPLAMNDIWAVPGVSIVLYFLTLYAHI